MRQQNLETHLNFNINNHTNNVNGRKWVTNGETAILLNDPAISHTKIIRVRNLQLNIL